MASFRYVALDAKGKERSGVIDAESQTAAVGLIREKGLFPTNVMESAEAPARAAKVKKKAPVKTIKGTGGVGSKEFKMPAIFSRVKPKLLMVVTRQLATLINAGMPLLRCLQVLHKQEKNPALKTALAELEDGIQSGSTLAEALAQHPRIFNRLYVNMVKAGEIGGVLDQTLRRLAEFMEKAHKIKSKVTSAMIYPIVVLIMAFGILMFLMTFVIPKFEDIFRDLLEGKALPGLTRLVLAISRAITQQAALVIVGIILIVVLIKLLGRTDGGRKLLDTLKLSFPLFGTLMKKTAISRFSRTLGTLMSSGVPVLQALTIVKDTAGNEVIANAVAEVHDAVKEGENMAPPLDATGVFPPIVVSMVEVGEETGDLPDMLMRVADAYDDEVDNAVAGLTSVIEPILIVFLAVVVGAIVIALFLPLIEVIGDLS